MSGFLRSSLRSPICKRVSEIRCDRRTWVRVRVRVRERVSTRVSEIRCDRRTWVRVRVTR